ncbi:MAG: hypothetical protein ABR551_09240 [Gemmatimonadales bacterium]
MTLSILAVLLAAWALVRRDAARRATLLIASLILGLAAASLAAAAGNSMTASLAQMPGSAPGVEFLQVAAGLTLLAMVMAVAAAPHLVTIGWAGLVGWVAWPLAQAGGLIRPAGIAALVAALGIFGWLALRRIRPGRVFVGLDQALLDRRNVVAWRPTNDWIPTAWPLVAAVASLLALTIPHLAMVLGGAVVATTATFIASRKAGRPAWALLLSVPLLVVVLLWTLHLSGPLGGWIPGLIDGPFSPRAAQALALLTSLALLPIAGLWPLHGVTVPVLLAPLLVAVGGTFAVLLIPDGIQWWQPVLAPLAVLAMAHAVARRSPAQLLVAAGVFGLWTGTRPGGFGGALLLVSAWMLVVVPGTWLGRLPVPGVIPRTLGLVPVVGTVAVLHGGLVTEVAYTVAATLVAAAGIQIMGTIHPRSG